MDIFKKYVETQFLLNIKGKNYKARLKPVFYKYFVDTCKEAIFDISAKTLVYLINECRQELIGNSAYDRYDYFNDILVKSQYQAYIMDRFPVLKSKIERAIIDRFSFCVDVQEHLNNDIEELRKKFRVLGECVKLTEMNSDRHQHGKTVLCLEFEQGKIIYKPRSLESDIIWNNLIDYLNKKSKVHLRGIHTLNCQTHGWQEFINATQCENTDEIKQVYKRIGALLNMAYLCGVTDIHMENLIIDRDMPYITDLETLFDYGKSGVTAIDQWILNSVLVTQMLPVLSGSKMVKKGCDMAAITGGAGGIKIKREVIKNPYTDQMQFVYEEIQYKKVKNIARYKGQYVDPRDYTEEIKEGFSFQYSVVTQNKLEIEKLFRDIIGPSFTSRIIYRDTDKYQQLLLLLKNPRYLASIEKSEALYNMLKADERIPNEIIDSEIANLRRGDIPYFLKDMRFHIFNDGEHIFTCESNDGLYSRLNSFSNEDLKKQLFCITFSLQKPTKNVVELYEFNSIISFQTIIDKTHIIIEEMINNCFINKNDNTIDWINIVNIFPNWGIDRQELDLYFGLPGNAIFFAAYYKITNDSKVLNYLHLIMNTIRNRLDKSVEGVSLFSGKMSLIYMFSVLSLILGWDFNDEIEKLCNEVIDEIEPENMELDLADGLSGVLLGFISSYSILEKPTYYEFIEKITKVIIHRVKSNLLKDKVDMGMAHGYAGIILALSKAYLLRKNKECVDAIQILEANIKVDEYNSDISWCHGIAGLGLMYLFLEHNFDNGKYHEKIERCAKILKNKVWNTSDCLCHGNMGTVDFFIQYSKLKSDKKALEYLKHFLCIYQTRNGKWYCGCKQDVVVYGLMLGLSGIGYELLRTLFPCDFPDVLILEI